VALRSLMRSAKARQATLKLMRSIYQRADLCQAFKFSSTDGASCARSCQLPVVSCQRLRKWWRYRWLRCGYAQLWSFFFFHELHELHEFRGPATAGLIFPRMRPASWQCWPCTGARLKRRRYLIKKSFAYGWHTAPTGKASANLVT